ncbi:efflux RND transporter permease subunit [Ferrimonas balearica]|uniref:efflux RND transporter permease subunit n=1 Tax=Ferrimonas balearica TaxID=44012 RepID=UPI001C969B00|nr:efflux RND transporter permease subunit [Ferrimonas balearica]MBY5979655.1 efflux RND transporter permease subunit [Ferrimonas balearica]MBY6105930.1 efflux RND transporter permease subunit [Ferrimonas balearica]MBY6223484.1 efflux RND transporter permease subunit [Ferrimonas balearica]
MANFFIDRPVFAWVLAILAMLAGILSLVQLPVAQYPNIAPPAIQVTAFYPGASAKTAEETVTQVIEQELTGLDGLRYISSESDSFGNSIITLTFEAGTDPDIAQVQVQNKVSGATAKLPEVVQRQGVVVEKSSDTFLMVMAFYSTDGSMTDTDLSDFVASNLEDPISRVPGVGSVQLFGAEYAMRIWLDPNRLESYGLNPSDVTAAIAEQNTQVSAGQLGATPVVEGQQLNATITARSLLRTPEEFERILLKVEEDGSEVRIRDVARVELGAANYSTIARYNGQPASGMGISLATGANALDTMNAVNDRIAELRNLFPPGVEMQVPYDTTPFVKLSIENVVHTLLEAVVLVFLVMFLFLQSFRATLIPTIAIPVVVLGTMAVLMALGYSINTLTMFAMVLAIGLLVDDAIVVVEGVERVMEEEGLPPLEATRKSMKQLSGALVGIGMVLSAVFVPMAFFGGTTGIIYRQFSITIVTAVALSVLVALILTPTLCVQLMKQGHGSGSDKGFFGWFNRTFDRATNGYVGHVDGFIRRMGRLMLIFVALAAVAGYLMTRLPTSFLPDEDQGVMIGMVMLPTGSTQAQTVDVLKQAEDYFLTNETEAVASVFSVAGFSFAGRGANAGILFMNMVPFKERTTEESSVWAVMGRAQRAFSQIKEAMVFVFAPPAIIELGTATGFDMYLQDRTGLGHDALMQGRNQLLGMAMQNPNLMNVRPNGLDDTPQFVIEIDQLKAEALGVSINDINNTLTTSFGSAYVNDFIDRGRVKQVYVQSDAQYRMVPSDIDFWYVRNNQGEMVPLKAITSTRWEFGSPRLERFNGVSAMQIQGQPKAGISTGVAMTTMEQLVSQLPNNLNVAWTGLSYEEREAGGQAGALYVLSILIVFLCLAALYESWSVPFSVILVVPLGVLGAVIATGLRGLDNDVYFQVGLLTTVGLSAKNAIMIVEFAKQYYEEGADMVEAALHAARVRLRPILMTSLAFGFGVLPLALSSGAGSGAQNAVGTGVIGGVITATFLGVFFVPLFFVFVSRLAHRKQTSPPAPEAPAQEGAV